MEEGGIRQADHGPAVGFVGARQQAKQRGLPDAVLTDQADALAGSDGEADAVEHPARAERPDEVMGQEGRLGQRHHRLDSQPGTLGLAAVAGVRVSSAHIATHSTRWNPRVHAGILGDRSREALQRAFARHARLPLWTQGRLPGREVGL